MFDLGGGELLLILVAVLVLFGPKKLPELAQGLGKGLRQFRKAQQEFNEQVTNAMREEERSDRSRNARPISPNTIAQAPGKRRDAEDVIDQHVPTITQDQPESEAGNDSNTIASPSQPPTQQTPSANIDKTKSEPMNDDRSGDQPS